MGHVGNIKKPGPPARGNPCLAKLWQGRFYSCPLDESHLWAAMRYTELNPVRAGMVETAELWPWSSAPLHCGLANQNSWLEMEPWRKRWTVAEWRHYLAETASAAEIRALRNSTHTGRPLGSEEFMASLEHQMSRPLIPRKAGRRKKPASSSSQLSFPSGA